MKLSAVVLLTVNLVAASQVAAHASDTASFLQDALTPSAKAAKASGQPATAPAHKAKKSSYVSMSPAMDGVKLRPFVPGRYLPSESELVAKKQAEAAAQQAAAQSFSPGNILSGQVATNASSMSQMGSIAAPAAYSSAYSMSRPVNQDYIQKVTQGAIQKVKQIAKTYSGRAVPGVNPVVPGQIAKIPGTPGAIPKIPEPQTSAPAAVQVPQPQSTANSCVVPPPQLTKYEASQLEKLVDANSPEKVYAQGNGESLPINAGTRGRPINPAVSQARFGSWHGGNGLTTASFHSYVPIHMTGPLSVKVSQHSTSHRTGTQGTAMTSHPTHAASQPKKVAAEKTKPDASYPPYRRYSMYM